jgi:hypothetical protein
MNQLDAMAARAVDSVHVAVATRAPIADVPRLVGMRRRGVALRFAMGTAALVVLVGIAGVMHLEETVDPADASSTTVPTTTTTIAPEVAVEPNLAIPIPEGTDVTKPPVTEPPAPPVTEPPATTTPPVTEPPDTTRQPSIVRVAGRSCSS